MKNLIAALLTLCMVWSVVSETDAVTATDGDYEGSVLANTVYKIK